MKRDKDLLMDLNLLALIYPLYSSEAILNYTIMNYSQQMIFIQLDEYKSNGISLVIIYKIVCSIKSIEVKEIIMDNKRIKLTNLLVT